MTDKAKLRQTVEDTMACTAFAEAGEPCPTEEQVRDALNDAEENEEEQIAPECALFHENGPQCFL